MTAVKQLSACVPAGMVLASCSVVYTQSYVRCPTTILSDLAWPCTVSLSAVLLVSLVGISQFSFQLLRILENVVSVAGRDGSLVGSCGCAGKLHTNA